MAPGGTSGWLGRCKAACAEQPGVHDVQGPTPEPELGSLNDGGRDRNSPESRIPGNHPSGSDVHFHFKFHPWSLHVMDAWLFCAIRFTPPQPAEHSPGPTATFASLLASSGCLIGPPLNDCIIHTRFSTCF